MPEEKSCVEPKIGDRIQEYNEDARLDDYGGTLSAEERVMFDIHLIRCRICRKMLTSEGQLGLKLVLILSGFFLDDPVQSKKRIETVRKFLRYELSFEKFVELKISGEEYQKIIAFVEEEGRG